MVEHRERPQRLALQRRLESARPVVAAQRTASAGSVAAAVLPQVEERALQSWDLYPPCLPFAVEPQLVQVAAVVGRFAVAAQLLVAATATKVGAVEQQLAVQTVVVTAVVAVAVLVVAADVELVAAIAFDVALFALAGSFSFSFQYSQRAVVGVV